MGIHFKPADTRQCLLFSSNHRNHCKKNIPFTLAQSICTIVENQQQKFEHLSEVKEDLKNDYPVNIKSNGIKKALKFLKINLGNQKKNKHEVLPFYCYTE